VRFFIELDIVGEQVFFESARESVVRRGKSVIFFYLEAYCLPFPRQKRLCATLTVERLETTMQKQMLVQNGPRRQRLMANITFVPYSLVHLSHMVSQSFPIFVFLTALLTTRILTSMTGHVSIQIVYADVSFVTKFTGEFPQRFYVHLEDEMLES
jgi:hypothetical protein